MAGFDYQGAIELFKQCKTAAVCGHLNPDGDCLGSVLALTQILRAMGLEVTPLLATKAKPEIYDFLPGYEELTPAGKYTATPDLFVMVDVPNDERISDGAAVLERAPHSVKIDHHEGPEDLTDLSYIDTSAAAVGVLIWELAAQTEVTMTAGIAQCCYTALFTDTGSFRFQNADQRAFAAAAEMVAAGAEPAVVATNVYQRKSMAAIKLESRVANRARFACGGRLVISWMDQNDLLELGATKDDCEELTDVVRQIDGPEICVILRGSPDSIRGSIRSKSDHDVRAIAKQMDGGGHRAAAGFTLHCSIKSGLQRVVDLVAESYDLPPESLTL